MGRSLALMNNDHVDGNKEMIAFGMMNIVGSFTSCYLTTGIYIYLGIQYINFNYIFRAITFLINSGN